MHEFGYLWANHVHAGYNYNRGDMYDGTPMRVI